LDSAYLFLTNIYANLFYGPAVITAERQATDTEANCSILVAAKASVVNVQGSCTCQWGKKKSYMLSLKTAKIQKIVSKPIIILTVAQ
jgi:hypothetical protein